MAVTQAQVQAEVAAVQAAIAAVPNFNTASSAEIASVQGAIAGALAVIGDAQGQVEAMMLGAASESVAGMVAGGQGLVATLTTQVEVMQLAPQLDLLAAVLTRISKNLASAAAGQSVTIAGGDLYTLAVQAYGDEDAWPSIAEANDLTDPVLTGVNVLTIPASPPITDGVLEP